MSGRPVKFGTPGENLFHLVDRRSARQAGSTDDRTRICRQTRADGLGCRTKPDHDPQLPHTIDVFRPDDHAPSGGDDQRVTRDHSRSHRFEGLRLEVPKALLTIALEALRNTDADLILDPLVGIDGDDAQSFGQKSGQSGLSRGTVTNEEGDDRRGATFLIHGFSVSLEMSAGKRKCGIANREPRNKTLEKTSSAVG